MATVTVKGEKEVQAALDFLVRLRTRPQLLREPTEEALDLLFGNIQPYPPELPNQQYIRTQTLFNSWQKVVVLSRGTLGRVTSDNVAYNQFVKQRATQAQVHQGRHSTVEDIAEKDDKETTFIYDRFIQRRLNELTATAR